MNEVKLRRILAKCGLNKHQIEKYLTHYKSLNVNNKKSIKDILDAYPHPDMKQVEQYESNRSNKLNVGYDFGGVDDLTVSKLKNQVLRNHISQTSNIPIVIITPNLIQNLTKIIISLFNIEHNNNYHLHKGVILHDTGLYMLTSKAIDPLEFGLLMINKAFVEDDMKHSGAGRFPLGPAYNHLNLSGSNPITLEIKNFLIREFLGNDTEFQHFYNRFLNLPTTISDDDLAFQWLEHIIFFNHVMMNLLRIWEQPKPLYHSYLGQILLGSMIGQLCLLIESICKLKLNITGEYGRIYAVLENGLYQNSWQVLTQTEKTQINNDFNQSNIQSTILDILKNRYFITDSIQCSFILAWKLRNNVMHTIHSHWFISREFQNIVKKIFAFLKDFIFKP